MRTVLFAHLNSFNVTKGQTIKKGTKIGVMGDSGYSFGTHLHLNVLGRLVDHDFWMFQVPSLGGLPKETLDFALAPGMLTYHGEDRPRRITTGYGDRYLSGVIHHGVDVVDVGSGRPDINWPLDFTGTVTRTGDFGENRWGKYVMIHFDENEGKAEIDSHIVAKGDTLSAIAAKYSTTVPILVGLNLIENPDLIFPGQRILLPGNWYTVQPGDTLSGIAAMYGTDYRVIAEKNDIKNPNLIFPGQKIRI